MPLSGTPINSTDWFAIPTPRQPKPILVIPAPPDHIPGHLST